MKSSSLFLCLGLLVCSGCKSSRSSQRAEAHPNAPILMIQYGCPTCHVIPGVPGAVGKVGPSLASLAQRSYLAGTIPNTTSDLQRWMMHPQQFRPGTAMPEMGVTPQDAREITAFLQSSR
jgi:cytochrome c2